MTAYAVDGGAGFRDLANKRIYREDLVHEDAYPIVTPDVAIELWCAPLPPAG